MNMYISVVSILLFLSNHLTAILELTYIKIQSFREFIMLLTNAGC